MCACVRVCMAVVCQAAALLKAQNAETATRLAEAGKTGRDSKSLSADVEAARAQLAKLREEEAARQKELLAMENRSVADRLASQSGRDEKEL